MFKEEATDKVKDETVVHESYHIHGIFNRPKEPRTWVRLFGWIQGYRPKGLVPESSLANKSRQ